MLKHMPSVSWQQAVDTVVAWGHNRNQVEEGSMPGPTLEKLSSVVCGHGLQIGGFVGVAHCCMASALWGRGTICTIDPNIAHRGIHDPLMITKRLVSHFGLDANSTLICGTSHRQMPIFESQNMKFDFILLDGNHDRRTVESEIVLADRLLKTGGLLILDDIDHWEGPRSLYSSFPLEYDKIPLDTRAGVLKKRSRSSDDTFEK